MKRKKKIENNNIEYERENSIKIILSIYGYRTICICVSNVMENNVT